MGIGGCHSRGCVNGHPWGFCLEHHSYPRIHVSQYSGGFGIQYQVYPLLDVTITDGGV